MPAKTYPHHAIYTIGTETLEIAYVVVDEAGAMSSKMAYVTLSNEAKTAIESAIASGAAELSLTDDVATAKDKFKPVVYKDKN